LQAVSDVFKVLSQENAALRRAAAGLAVQLLEDHGRASVNRAAAALQVTIFSLSIGLGVSVECFVCVLWCAALLLSWLCVCQWSTATQAPAGQQQQCRWGAHVDAEYICIHWFVCYCYCWKPLVSQRFCLLDDRWAVDAFFGGCLYVVVHNAAGLAVQLLEEHGRASVNRAAAALQVRGPCLC
jgi:hypothetical protein